jgi:1,4-alpha-glucan branching enzyme
VNAETSPDADARPTLLSDADLYLFNEGSHLRLYEKLGAHLGEVEGTRGVHFAVWAPNAARVSVIGDFNGWMPQQDELQPRASSGIWEGFVPGAGLGARYKYRIVSHDGSVAEKSDPFAFQAEVAPATASVVQRLDYAWQDTGWMESRAARARLDAPLAVYEVHLGSWRRGGDTGERMLSYREIAPLLADHVHEMGFTHVELMPLMEHPFYGSWGYQTTGYFAATSRHGAPQDLMYLIDLLHQREIGVILDWVPSHFVTDAHGLGVFDGTHLYEHADERQRVHPDWTTYLFNYGRHEVRSFLLSSAMFWLDKYHADGLRIDAVASMLYLDYSREEGEWVPNVYGGRENLEALEFLRNLNSQIYAHYPDVQTIAEESTSWPMVSRPVHLGGLGFGLKWDMGWMNDTLRYMEHDPVHRGFHHHDLTFRAIYAFTENFMLPLSHDEVVHGKSSLLAKMPGDDWQKFANLRLLLGYMYLQPGKKLLFMGGEFGQWSEWNHDVSLDWHVLEHAPHQGLKRWVRDLNTTYRAQAALHELDCEPGGFAWLDCNDAQQSTLSFLRRGRSDADQCVVVCNFTPMPRQDFRVGVPPGGGWREILNSDAGIYGGSGQGNLGRAELTAVPWHGHPCSILITLPPLAVVAFAREA